MRMIDWTVQLENLGDKFELVTLGDEHVGKINCSEQYIRNKIAYIKANKNVFWFGGGDYCDAIKPKDVRFDFRGLADWILDGDAKTVRGKLANIVRQQRERFAKMVMPIRDRCIGLIEGNHESSVNKWSNEDHHQSLCEMLNVADLTDACFIRLRFRRPDKKCAKVVVVDAKHGYGGGRSPGAERNHLNRLVQSTEADIVLRGHSHTFDIAPPTVRLGVPRSGQLPDECTQRMICAGNWGCSLKSYAAGPPTYESQANYSPKPMMTIRTRIKPFAHVPNAVSKTRSFAPKIEMEQWRP